MKKPSMKATIREKGRKDISFKKIPGVLYGPEAESQKVWVSFQEFSRVYNEAGGSTLIDLELEGEKVPRSVLIHDIQYFPISDKYRHIDFYQVKMGQKIETEIELEFIGEAPAVKEKGGILVKTLDSVEIRCLPKDLISRIDVDVAMLKELDDVIHVKDLSIPEAIEVKVDLGTVVASIEEPRSQEELDQLDEKVEMDIDQVEGIKEEEGEDEKAEGEKSSSVKDGEEKEKKE